MISCAEPTDISNQKNKTKMLSNLSLLRGITRTPPPLNTSVRDKDDPLQMYNLGDEGIIDLKQAGQNYTFDYTGLGIDDSLLTTESNLLVLYFDNNINYIEQNYNSIYPSNDENNSFTWTLANVKTEDISYSPSLTTDIFKYSTTLNNFTNQIERVVVKLTYIPLDSPYNFIYFYKGLSDGSGELEIVGYQVIIRADNYLLENAGDTRLRSPYVPSGYNG